jgi:hypothetical protein
MFPIAVAKKVPKVPEPNCFWRNDDIDEKEINSGTFGFCTLWFLNIDIFSGGGKCS